MVEESAPARPSDPRVSTGNPSLDAMLEGGLVARRPYLIVGPSGTGKTSLALQFLCDGVRRGEHVLMVTLEEPPNEARVNHRGLEPIIDRVEVFDAIPDIMRYERTPFKDISSVRSAVPFRDVPLQIRTSPELASVEVTITALEQMLRTEVTRKNYTRLVIDSLTALQYFCMKGFDPIAGAQSLLRFLSDLRVTTILTVESPLEDVETPERMLARGEIRLFRWELEGQTVRAVGVEKFRGSSHDVRLHPYRIGPQGIDINLDVTISRDTRQIIEPIVRRPTVPPTAAPAPVFVSAVTPLVDEVRDLILLGADVGPVRSAIEAAHAATTAGKMDEAQAHLTRVSSLVIGLVDTLGERPRAAGPDEASAAAALQRVIARADSVRTGVPPTSLPAQSVLEVQLGALLSLLPPPAAPPPPPPPPPPEPVAVPQPVPPTSPTREPVPPPEIVIAPPETLPPPAEGSPEREELPPSAPPVAEIGETPTRAVEASAVAMTVVDVPAVVSSAPVPAPATPVVTVSETPPPPAPAAPVEVPVATEMPEVRVERAPEPTAPTPPVRTSKPLPPPPKPRSPITDLRVVRPAAAPPSPRSVAHETPPPLPKAATPDWSASPPTFPSTPAEARGGARASSGSAAVAHGAHAPAAPVVPLSSKRRRKASVSASGRRAASAARESAELPPPHPETAAPLSPIGAAGASPLENAPPAHPGAGASSKSRRKPPRKRKAPPVVAVTVESTPPEASSPRERSPPDSDSTDAPVPREG
jgi:KaiC/GvpD/RAD55 family RecA-like ATPase